MKRFFFLLALLTTQSIFGFHAGLGFGWNTIDETFSSNLITNEDRSGQDHYHADVNRLAPVIQLGHQFYLCDDWSIGLSLDWKYLNYKTPNVSSSRGQILPNASFSSINIFGAEVIRDFTSITRLNNEIMLLATFGKKVLNGYAYLGLGPIFFDGSNRIYVSSVHIPNGVGDHLISTSIKRNKLVWGGAVQAGYQYFFCSDYFIYIHYTYLQTGECHFQNSVNTNILNGFNTPGPTTLFLKRKIKFSVQEFVVTMNLAF